MQTMESGSQGFRGDKNSIGICVRDVIFCPWPENLNDTELKKIMG